MEQLRFYHSLWTKPLTDDKVYITKLCYALSFSYVKRMGGYIVLHTDSRGTGILEDIPYDEVIIDLDGIDDRYAAFWAYGKIVATAHEPVGSIHLDGDVFFINPDLANAFSLPCDVFVQNTEFSDRRLHHCYEDTQEVVTQGNMPPWLHIGHPLSFNCGITRFSNADFKEKYILAYFLTVERCLADTGFFKRLQSKRGNAIPDIVAEQQVLHELARRDGVSVGVLLPDGVDQGKYADSVGYCHLCSHSKFEKQEELERNLEKIDGELFREIKG